MMKRSVLLLLFTLVLCVSLTNAVTEEIPDSDGERELLTARQKKKRAARAAKRAAKKAARKAAKRAQKEAETPYEPEPHPEPEPEPEPEKGMYFELVYMEKMCKSFAVQQDNATQYSIGDYVSFTCELYENSVRFGTYGGEFVGRTWWYCSVASFFDVTINFQEFSNNALWDCTITDYIGGDNDNDIEIEDVYIRNEGITVGISNFDEASQSGSLWENFHSHTGTFAVMGGTLDAKGIKGEMEVIWDDYKMTWFHIYHVEAWNIGPQPMYW
eukprot:15366359-Ditylum_brightwellii.AAC.1